jgi:hypothetical protein
VCTWMHVKFYFHVKSDTVVSTMNRTAKSDNMVSTMNRIAKSNNVDSTMI